MFSPGACFGGRSPICKLQRFYDLWLDNLVIYKNHRGRPHDNDVSLYPVENVDIHKVWEVFRQQLIDECFNKGSRTKWTAVPYLNVADSPCEPGSVILVKNRKFKDKLAGRSNVAFFAGSNMDYVYTRDIEEGSSAPPIQVKTSATNLQRDYFRVYQSKDSEKAVIISLVMEDRRDMLNPGDFEKVRMDIDIFEDTGIKNRYCYLVTNVLTARSVKLEMTQDGDIFYELEYKAVPICFQATKVRVIFDTKGMLEKIKPVKGILDLNFRRKRIVDPLLNAFMPNQNRLNNFGGDCPPIIPIILPLPIQSFRPKILPRQDRPKNEVVWYFSTEAELRSIQYNFNQDPRLNRLLGSGSVTPEDTDDETDDDDDVSEGDDCDSNGVGHPYSFYPQPEIRSYDIQD